MLPGATEVTKRFFRGEYGGGQVIVWDAGIYAPANGANKGRGKATDKDEPEAAEELAVAFWFRTTSATDCRNVLDSSAAL